LVLNWSLNVHVCSRATSKKENKNENVDDEKNASNAYVPFNAYRPSDCHGDRSFLIYLELPRHKKAGREVQ
jgi:hypothetical protein